MDKILGLGSVIEFYDQHIKEPEHNGSILVDKITAIHIFSDNSTEYWTAIYPEVPGVLPDIKDHRIVGCLKEVPFVMPDNMPKYPVNVGDHVSFNWDGDPISGIVTEQFIVINGYMAPEWRVMVKGGREEFYLCQDESEDYDLKVE